MAPRHQDSSHFSFDNGRMKVGRIGIEFGIGVGERRDGSDVDATLHRDASPITNPKEYIFSFSAKVTRGADPSGGVEDALIIGGTCSVGLDE